MNYIGFSVKLSDNKLEIGKNAKSQQDNDQTEDSSEQLTTLSKTSSSHEVIEKKAFEAFTILWSYLKDYVDMVEIPFGDFENVYLQWVCFYYLKRNYFDFFVFLKFSLLLNLF